MTEATEIVTYVGLVAAAAPFGLVALLGVTSLLDRQLPERATAVACQ